MDQRVDTSHIPPVTAPRKKPSRRAKLIGGVIALLTLGGLGWLAWHLTHQDEQNNQRGPGRGAPTTTVGVASVEQVNIPVIIDALGTVTASATATVRPQVSGVLQQVLFREGEMVRAGQVMAVIDPRPFEMTLMQATGQRQRDEAQLENARITLKRFQTLLQQDSIARQEVDTQAALVKQLEGTIIADRAAEGTAKLNLGYTKIVAPISGRVGLRVVDIGNLVGANDANGIAVITQTSPIDVEFSVPQDRVPELQAQIGSGAPLAVSALDRTRATVLDTGKFLAMDNQVDTQTGTVRAKARFANPKAALFPSQFVNVQLLLRTIEGALVIPINALRHGGKGDFVYVLNEAERTVALRPVTRGQAAGEKIQVVSGLQAGEKVITEGADRLKDGAKVTLPGDKPQAPGGGQRRGQRGEGKGAQAGSGQPPAAAPQAGRPGAASDGASKESSPGSEERPRRRRQQDGAAP